MLRIKQFYLEEWKWFKTKFLKIFIIVSIIFILSVLISHIILIKNPEELQEISAFVTKGLLTESPVPEKSIKQCLIIFLNNSIASLICILSGLIPFLFLPIIGLLRNGIVVGVITSISHVKGFKVLPVLLFSAAPHGIFELPAIFYSTSLGVYLCLRMSKKILNLEKEELTTLFPEGNLDYRSEEQIPLFTRLFKTYIGVIIPLTMVAAIIETFISRISILYKIFLVQ
ncbi:MAG: stage II sporulation protein M [Candidatus Aminicenantes bacterium]|nr:stage II sporulation protein M [Candidatus Aminicenantes bacterium]